MISPDESTELYVDPIDEWERKRKETEYEEFFYTENPLTGETVQTGLSTFADDVAKS